MRRKRLTASDLQLCPAIGFSRIMGGKYKLRIVWVLNKRPHRYSEIAAALLRGSMSNPVTPRVLSRELRQLREWGLIHREEFPGVPPKVVYSLTERGAELMPILQAIVDWGLTGAHEEILGVAPEGPRQDPQRLVIAP